MIRLKRPRQKDPSYLTWIRDLPCVICRRTPVDACHIRMGDLSWGKQFQGWGKPSDHWVTPMCREHHELQHKIGEEKFWQEHKIDPFKLASALSHNRYDDEMAEIIIGEQCQ